MYAGTGAASAGSLLPLAQSLPLILRTCDRIFTLDCSSDLTRTLLTRVYSAMVQSETGLQPVREYTVTGSDSSESFVLSDATARQVADGADDLVYHVDKAIIVALQLERPELFFLHAAAVAVNGRVVALPASPGTGKSTLTLALLESGLEYLSDELAPINLADLTVVPYPHAICLKSPPPAPYQIPEGTMTVDRRFHVPVESLPAATRRDPLPLSAIVFPRRDETRFQGLRTLSTASAATRLMAHLLNGLAHPNYGLDSAISLSRTVPCFEIDVSDLPGAVRAIAAL